MSIPDIDLSTVEFDLDAPATKIRKFGGGVTYIQNGIKFSSGYAPLEVLDVPEPVSKKIDDMTLDECREALHAVNALHATPKKPAAPKKVVKKTKPLSARERADKKLQDFKAPEKPDFVHQALQENADAKRAESLSE